MAASLQKLLEGSEVIRPVLLKNEELEQFNQMVEDGDLAAVVIIPPGYTNQLLADQQTMLEVIANASQPGGRTASRALETVTGRLLGTVEAAHISKGANPETSIEETVVRKSPPGKSQR